MAEEQSEETKQEAREFMSGLVGSADNEISTTVDAEAFADMAAWKDLYSSSLKADKIDPTLMEMFWKDFHNVNSTSIWTMVYDEADSNENLEDTIQIAKDFIQKSKSLKDHCFGVIHTLENLEVEGLWFFNGSDPEKLFGTNEDTSWFTWNQIGPEANDHVKAAVAAFITPIDGKLNGKTIKDTQAFC